MLHGLDLFSGSGVIAFALNEWVRPVAYCEKEPFAQAVLLSRIADGRLCNAPIWDDVTTLDGKPWRGNIDIITAGFPCQDVSCAGRGAGLEGKRSGLFFEVMRLADEVRPPFIFLENVPAIRTRGLATVASEFTRRGYDCRWKMLSARDVGAPHVRKRWWCLAADRKLIKSLANADSKRREIRKCSTSHQGSLHTSRYRTDAPHSSQARLMQCRRMQKPQNRDSTWHFHDWSTEPDVCRVVDGLPNRVDRVKSLGNSVVPQCARQALEQLMGI